VKKKIEFTQEQTTIRSVDFSLLVSCGSWVVTPPQNPEDHDMNLYRRENLKYRNKKKTTTACGCETGH
jgi:hypothetical protein